MKSGSGWFPHLYGDNNTRDSCWEKEMIAHTQSPRNLCPVNGGCIINEMRANICHPLCVMMASCASVASPSLKFNWRVHYSLIHVGHTEQRSCGLQYCSAIVDLKLYEILQFWVSYQNTSLRLCGSVIYFIILWLNEGFPEQGFMYGVSILCQALCLILYTLLHLLFI